MTSISIHFWKEYEIYELPYKYISNFIFDIINKILKLKVKYFFMNHYICQFILFNVYRTMFLIFHICLKITQCDLNFSSRQFLLIFTGNWRKIWNEICELTKIFQYVINCLSDIEMNFKFLIMQDVATCVYYFHRDYKIFEFFP